MFKYILVLVTFTFTIYAKTIQFSEEKYFESLEMTFYNKGKITFLKDKIEVVYESDTTVLTYSDNLLIKEKGLDKTELDLRRKPAIKMFFVLFEAIYFDKKKILQLYFTAKTDKGMTTLTPNKNIAVYIDSVHYKKQDKHLEFLKINMRNKDRILIEETY